ncbi:MAG: DNA alkylation repair protein [Candidatus Zambryskibacteria bacterium RIFCSPHIGHO2_12_FULL_38_34]|uniref:DNA alkylation repair protein n=1 Tax=Candidatus Zambryskibacteria bacterium RIFCSPLOWO2_12_FULL_39_16 TaxID=1802775 RepID=A0A1G2UQJ0_9BACT|nr:MAG: DNA alkylation repair protein [Candidatus Zambryskibacteria bacterium RIFCSPHIGHO2_02_FULL_38_22]OHA97512.1 MAG: DNA alkylation repair protein [Candidatus Zambryskibacteria bacterium RIFCSPHIGHO2_12_FULL_38_34]OHB11659.1 MAG: DNA alkylation repair protein [Candidatus Zambryskibacteria bacterium RIFCSPLOWO2_12_FULL_39_16]
MINKIKKELRKEADKNKAKILAGFFKTKKGEYGEGDKFLGVVMPKQHMIVKKYADKISVEDALNLLNSKIHEERMTALLILVSKYRKGELSEKKQIFSLYLKNTKLINNWDLVDVTCRDIVGAYLFEKDKNILYKLAKSKNLWEKRIAIVSTFYFISKGDVFETFKIAKMLLHDRGDLIHKAVGWALREAGKKDKVQLVKFLEENGSKIPRTMLRYAIEKFSLTERKRYLARF